jgi:hypothetical protein
MEEGRTVYYPDVRTALEKPRLNSEWRSYFTTVERKDFRGEEQTFAVQETPFSKINFDMVPT